FACASLPPVLDRHHGRGGRKGDVSQAWPQAHAGESGAKGFANLVAHHFAGDKQAAAAWLHAHASESEIARLGSECHRTRLALDCLTTTITGVALESICPVRLTSSMASRTSSKRSPFPLRRSRTSLRRCLPKSMTIRSETSESFEDFRSDSDFRSVSEELFSDELWCACVVIVTP